MRKILPWIAINGNVVTQEKAVISVFDEGFMYGYGFFTTIKVREGIPLFLDKHCSRLQNYAEQLSMELQSFASIKVDIMNVIEKNEIDEGAIRITVTKRAANETTVVIHATTIDSEIHSVPVITVPEERDVYKTIKMTYRVPHLLAMQKAQEQGAQDALFTHEGFVVESTYANAYSYSEKTGIITPPIAGRALDSISRKILFKQLPITEQEIPENTVIPMILVSSLSIRIVEKINGKNILQDSAFVSKVREALDTAETEYIAAHKI